MQKQFVTIHIPLSLKNSLVENKGNKSYENYLLDLMKREGQSFKARPSQAPSEDLTNG